MFIEGMIPLQTICKRDKISIKTSLDWRYKLSNALLNAQIKFHKETQVDDI